MIVIGIVLLLLGFLTGIVLLETIGVILLVLGLILLLLGAFHPVGPRRWYY